jgi:hypothetical protein
MAENVVVLCRIIKGGIEAADEKKHIARKTKDM